MSEKKNEVFLCPYCNKAKDRMELNFHSEIGNFQPTIEKFGDIRDVNDYKYMKFKYTRYEVPICDDCLFIHEESSTKATIIALCFFIPTALYLLFQYHDFMFCIIPGMVCLLFRWIIKAILIKRKGIRYYAHNYAFYSSHFYDPPMSDSYASTINQIIQHDINESMVKAQLDEIEKKQEEWKRHHETIEIDLGNGQKRYITRYISDDELSEREIEKNNIDYTKKKKLEEGAHINYDDDDFEGIFV